LVLAATGCYATEIRSGTSRPGAATHQHRQWFTVGGLVSLSEPVGDECDDAGTSYARSEVGFVDILLNVAIGVGSTAAGLAICDSEADPESYAACVSGTGALGNFLLGSRTVKYQCRAGVSAGMP
jgi:hypothetical protein